MYRKLPDTIYGVTKAILLVEENKSIPFDPTNTDYQAYLAWLAEGNEPLPAEEQQ